MPRDESATSDLQAWAALAASGWELTDKQRWFHTTVLYPTILSVVERRRPQAILDFGAGRGHLSELLRERGWAPQIYEPAAGMVPDHLLAGAYTSADEIPEGRYDCVIANLVVSAMPSLDVAMSELLRPLAPSGTLVMTLPHPWFALIDELHSTTGRRWTEPPPNPQLGNLSRYARGASQRVQWADGGPETSLYYRPLSSYTASLAQAGLALEQVLEPVAQGRDDQAPLGSTFETIPPFLVLVAQRSS